MKKTNFVIYLFSYIVSFLFFSSTCYAKNNQNIVIGVGLGTHIFSSDDDFRRDTDINATSEEYDSDSESENELIFALANDFLLEWYVLDIIGIGFRYSVHHFDYQTSYASIKYNVLDEYDIYRSFEIKHQIATINIVPFSEDRYARMILTAGFGLSHYKFEEKFESNPSHSRDYEFEGESTGQSTLLGICVDWGGEGFGARAGAEYFKTDFEDVIVKKSYGTDEKLELDGTGVTYYIGLRWAF